MARPVPAGDSADRQMAVLMADRAVVLPGDRGGRAAADLAGAAAVAREVAAVLPARCSPSRMAQPSSRA